MTCSLVSSSSSRSSDDSAGGSCEGSDEEVEIDGGAVGLSLSVGGFRSGGTGRGRCIWRSGREDKSGRSGSIVVVVLVPRRSSGFVDLSTVGRRRGVGAGSQDIRH